MQSDLIGKRLDDIEDDDLKNALTQATTSNSFDELQEGTQKVLRLIDEYLESPVLHENSLEQLFDFSANILHLENEDDPNAWRFIKRIITHPNCPFSIYSKMVEDGFIFLSYFYLAATPNQNKIHPELFDKMVEQFCINFELGDIIEEDAILFLNKIMENYEILMKNKEEQEISEETKFKLLALIFSQSSPISDDDLFKKNIEIEKFIKTVDGNILKEIIKEHGFLRFKDSNYFVLKAVFKREDLETLIDDTFIQKIKEYYDAYYYDNDEWIFESIFKNPNLSIKSVERIAWINKRFLEESLISPKCSTSHIVRFATQTINDDPHNLDLLRNIAEHKNCPKFLGELIEKHCEKIGEMSRDELNLSYR